MRAARKVAELADSGETFQSLPPGGMEVTVAFTDASTEGGGFSATRKGSVVEMEVNFDPSKLPTHHSMYTEALQLTVVLRKCCRVHRDIGHSVLSDTYIIYFTDNDPPACALTHRHSSNGRLQQLALEILKRVQSLNSFLLFLLRIMSPSKGCSPIEHPYTRDLFLCQRLQSDIGKRTLPSPPASLPLKYGRNMIRAG